METTLEPLRVFAAPADVARLRDRYVATGRAPYRPEFLRPGGTVSGPVMMALADFVMYAAVLGRIGRVELTVTTNLSINFLRRPSPRDVIAHARLIKSGRRLAVGEVDMYSEGEDDMIAHVTCTYSIPPVIGDKP